MPIFFSVVIATYNRSGLIRGSIDSVLSQRYTGFEVIVVDDGSTDNTEEVIQSAYGENSAVKYHRIKNSERAAARNYGAKKSNGDYIMFLDSDDKLLSNHLEEASIFINQENNPEVFHLNYEVKNENGMLVSGGPKGMQYANKNLIQGNFLALEGMMMRRNVFLENQFYEDRTMAAMEDWELWLRLAARYRIHMIDTVTSKILNHNERSVLQINRDKLIARVEKLIDRVVTNDEVATYYRKDLSKFKASCYTYVALHLAIEKKYRNDVVSFLLKGIGKSASVLFSRRFLAIIKNLL